MKFNNNSCHIFLFRFILRINSLILSFIYYKIARFQYKPIFLALLLFFISLLCILVYVQKQINIINRNIMLKGIEGQPYFNITSDHLIKLPSLSELKVKWIQNKIERISKKIFKKSIANFTNVEEFPVPSHKAHIFYYAWFRTPEDGSWQHWNKTLNKHNNKIGDPPEDIYSSFYPYLGCYSSMSPSVIDYHMKIIRKAGIGVVIISWVPPPFPDSPKDMLKILMDIAFTHDLKIAFQIHYYENRTCSSIMNQIKYLKLKFGDHPSLYLMEKNNRLLPVFYIYESYKINANLWNEILSEKGNISLRKTKYDGIFIGHLKSLSNGKEIKHASFDGLYTYSSGNGLTYGSSWKNWNSIAKFCNEKGLIFVPSVGPGFSDMMHIKSTRHRLQGHYYEVGWRSALSVKPRFISITSFNNWQDGSQIEPAKPKKTPTRVYLDYEPEGPHFYIDLTRFWIKKFISIL